MNANTFHYLAITILSGLVIGVLARFLLPGPDPIGWLRTILVGIAGSFLGSLAADFTGLAARGSFWGLALSVLGAMLLLLVYRKLGRKPA